MTVIYLGFLSIYNKLVELNPDPCVRGENDSTSRCFQIIFHVTGMISGIHVIIQEGRLFMLRNKFRRNSQFSRLNWYYWNMEKDVTS